MMNKNKFSSTIMRHNFSFPLILQSLNINIPDDSTGTIYYSILILLLILLTSFINIVAYLLAIMLIDKINIINKYPKLKKLVIYYKNTSFIFIVIEIIICLFIILLFIIISLKMMYQ